jgi:hypothetical protein
MRREKGEINTVQRRAAKGLVLIEKMDEQEKRARHTHTHMEGQNQDMRQLTKKKERLEAQNHAKRGESVRKRCKTCKQ